MIYGITPGYSAKRFNFTEFSLDLGATTFYYASITQVLSKCPQLVSIVVQQGEVRPQGINI
jgi:hypothetical protein